MRSKHALLIASGVLSTAAVLSWAQAPAAAPQTGPGIQSAQDAKEPEVLAGCKTPPPARGPAAAGRGRAGGPPPSTAMREYTVTEIPGVIAAGQKWTEVWKVDGNNADGIIGTRDGGILIAQNSNSDVIKLDKNGKTSVAYSKTNTGGALAMNTKGVLFLNNRGLNSDIVEFAPKQKVFANKYPG